MKNLLRVTILMLLGIHLTNTAMSQNLYTYPFTEKEIILIETAKEAVLKYGPGYYKKTHQVKIEFGKSQEENTLGRPYYVVTFIYNKKEELFDQNYAAKVFIWADIGKVTSVRFGNRLGYSGLDKESEIRSQIPYQPRSKM